MPKSTATAETPLSIARQLDAWGFNVLPTPIKQKSPRVEWKKWITDRSTRMVPSWFTARGESNYWVATGGVSGLYVLDIDNAAADRWWRDVVGFGEQMDSTVRVRTSKGTHYYFHVEANDFAKGWAFHDQGLDFDVRGTGGGVVVPPSIHESGFVYEWIQAPDPNKPLMGMLPAPDWIKSRESVRQWIESKGGAAPGEPGKGSPSASPVLARTNTASMLSALLGRPPKEGGRNDWLTRVAGHYAKTYRMQQDLYVLHVKQANALLPDPLDDDEVEKTLNSIWVKETTEHPERDIQSTGWLLSGGDRILTQVRVGKGEDAELRMAEWADFDLRVQGVMAKDGDEGDLVYDVTLRRKRDGSVVETILPGKILGAPPKLQAWLSGFGVSVARPENCWPANPPDATRLLRYLDSQEAPRTRMARALGWDDDSEGFLTFDGVIRPDGQHPFMRVRPNPALRTAHAVRFNYGFEGDWAEARGVLAEVLSFHDEETAAVFGSWWAACFLKPQLAKQLSLFPIMAIEAASGAGKTNGMFGLLMQLNGSLEGPGIMTMASARDRMASHHNGITWLDDLEQLGRIEELLRVTTSGESLTKKDINNEGNVTATLTSPVVISGEYLGLGTQKALLDRIVLLNPPKPDGRTSLKDGREGEPQWDDIVQLINRYPTTQDGERGLSVLAGHYVARALTFADRAVARLREIRREVKKTASGRQADKIALMLVGAWLLDRMVDDLADDATGPWEARVVKWAQTSEALQSAGEWDNRLTLEIVPWALREYQWPSSGKGGPPVFVREASDLLGAEVWVNVPRLAEEWRNAMRGRIVDRTDTEKALLDQVKRCQDTPRSARIDTTRPGSSRRMQLLYWALSAEVATVVIARSEGDLTTR